MIVPSCEFDRQPKAMVNVKILCVAKVCGSNVKILKTLKPK